MSGLRCLWTPILDWYFFVQSNDEIFIIFFRQSDITDEEYNEFYKNLSKDSDEPLAKVHFVAEGEVTFKSILFVPKSSPHDTFQNYGKNIDNIKVCKDIF